MGGKGTGVAEKVPQNSAKGFAAASNVTDAEQL